MSKLVRRAHNKTNLVYHLVCVVKYRKNVLTENITNTIVNVCLEIQEKYKIEFVETSSEFFVTANKNGYKPYSLFNSSTSKIFSDTNSNNDKKFYGKKNI